MLGLLAALIGAANIAATPPQRLDTDRWAVAQLYGKLANLVGDVDPRTFKETATFKQATGQDMLQGEHKYAAPFTFTSRVLIVAAFNSLPRSIDTTEGFFSRWLVVPFPNRFADPDENGNVPAGCLAKDPELAEMVTDGGELEGFVVRAVDGLRRVMDRGQFSRAEAVVRAEAEFRRNADPVRGFLADRVIAEEGDGSAAPSCILHSRDGPPTAVSALCRRDGSPRRSAGPTSKCSARRAARRREPANADGRDSDCAPNSISMTGAGT